MPASTNFRFCFISARETAAIIIIISCRSRIKGYFFTTRFSLSILPSYHSAILYYYILLLNIHLLCLFHITHYTFNSHCCQSEVVIGNRTQDRGHWRKRNVFHSCKIGLNTTINIFSRANQSIIILCNLLGPKQIIYKTR